MPRPEEIRLKIRMTAKSSNKFSWEPPVNFKHSVTGVPKIPNKFSREYTGVPVHSKEKTGRLSNLENQIFEVCCAP